MPRKTLTPKGFNPYDSELVDDCQTAFMTYLKSLGRSTATLTTYRHGIESLDRWLGDHASLLTVDETMGRQYIASMDGVASSSTIVTYWCALRAFYKWAVEVAGLMTTNPFANIKKPKLHETLVPNIPLDDAQAMLGVCLPNEYVGVRDRAIISLLFSTGMRRGELVGLKLGDYDRKEHTLQLMGKGNRYRKVYVDESTRVHLNAYLRIRKLHGLAETTDAMWLGSRGPLAGTAIGQMLTRRAKQAGVSSRINPHAWRHTYAHNFLDAGGQQSALVASGGWKNHRMIDVYAKADANARAIREQERLNLGSRMEVK